MEALKSSYIQEIYAKNVGQKFRKGLSRSNSNQLPTEKPPEKLRRIKMAKIIIEGKQEVLENILNSIIEHFNEKQDNFKLKTFDFEG